MYILNENNEILDNLKSKLNNFDELNIAVSYLTLSGFELLFDMAKLNDKVKIVTTVDDFITEPRLLKILLDKGCKIKIISKKHNEKGNRSLHSKFMVFKKGDKLHSVLGSLNITKTALINKFESVVIDYKPDELIFQFNKLWEYGIDLDDAYLKEYEEKYTKYKNEFKSFENLVNLKLDLNPNEMQIKVLNELEEVRKNGKNKALLYAATGTGKTYLSAFDLKRTKFKKILFIVHSRLIIGSAMEDYSFIFEEENILELETNNDDLVENSDIIFSTEKTINIILEKNPNFLENFDYFIFDEAHKIGPNNIQGHILNKAMQVSESFILAMTATPWRSDDPEYLINIFDNTVVGNINLIHAIENGLVCNFKYFGVDVDVDFTFENLKELELNNMVEKFIQKLETLEVWDGTKVKGIIFTSDTPESDKVSNLINSKYGYNSVSLHSNSKGELKNIEQAKEYINRLKNDKNDLNFIVCVNKFNEGIDIPRINTIGMFRFTESNIVYTQQIGRGLRREGTDKKYLNIIDLVGNHDNSFERIIGLRGDGSINPRDIIETIHEFTKEETNFEISEISRGKILANISKNISFKKYFIDKIISSKNKQLKIWDLEKYLGEDIQLIINNFRSNSHFTTDSKSWLEEIVSIISGKEYNFTNIESGIIEIFSWLPLTVSTAIEKKKILDLLKGNKVKFEQKWINYFNADGVKNTWRPIYGDYSNFFTIENEYVIFNKDLCTNKEQIELLNIVEKYLEINIDRNDFLKNAWYSRMEISFMSGIARRNMKPYIKIGNETFVMNGIDNDLYKNKVISKNEYVFSATNSKRDSGIYSSDRIYHNFMSKEIFHESNLNMFLYVGKQSSPISFIENVETETGESYKTYKFISEIEISESDYKFLNLKL